MGKWRFSARLHVRPHPSVVRCCQAHEAWGPHPHLNNQNLSVWGLGTRIPGVLQVAAMCKAAIILLVIRMGFLLSQGTSFHLSFFKNNFLFLNYRNNTDLQKFWKKGMKRKTKTIKRSIVNIAMYSLPIFVRIYLKMYMVSYDFIYFITVFRCCQVFFKNTILTLKHKRYF